jgi:hypothetical protein
MYVLCFKIFLFDGVLRIVLLNHAFEELELIGFGFEVFFDLLLVGVA